MERRSATSKTLKCTVELISQQVYIASRDAKACEETAGQLTKDGPGKCIAIPVDLAKYEECERLVKELHKRERGEISSSSRRSGHPRSS